MINAKLTRLAAIAAAAALGGCTSMLLPPNVAPVVAPTTSMAEAQRKLASVAEQRAAIEAQFAASERECYEKFFVNSCLDKAREKRRSALVYQKAIDVEAEYFRRKFTADERDREVARAVKQYELEEAQAAAQQPSKPVAVPEAAPARPGRPTLQERRAQRDARLAERAQREREQAPARAAREKELEQKRRESEQRQREVAQKIAEREAKKAPPAEPQPADAVPVKK
jgi:colicin import membrane protein